MGRTDSSGYLDLRGLDGAQFRALLEAAERAHGRVIAEGSQAFHDPSFYPGFVKHFSELIALLRSGIRSVTDIT
jgi:hypothetical protein